MLDAIDGINKFTEGMSEKEYLGDEKTRAAVERYMEKIGEAANTFPESFYTKHLQVKWHKVIAFRNRLIHGYFDINNKIVWQAVKEYLPQLKIQLEEIAKQY